ncbi:MAG TPA: hypothetical protein VFL63_01825 [Rhodanobacteraceae bacterium]|jgi:RNA polymerase sigma-70 factor (ECF subfamily)|nr:hypothetical protein [Rhodanobacteraceae bacterium]
MNSVAGRRADDFSKTRWTIVQRLQAPHAGDASQALTELALRYWYPVYACVRHCGHAPEIAQDITSAFFQRIASAAGDAGLAPRGRFRDWLLARLNAFLAGDWRDLADGEPAFAPSLEVLEQRNRDDFSPGDPPERAFQRGFALELLARGFKALQAEARQTGHLAMYEVLEPYLAHDPAPGQIEAMGRQLGIRPLALVLALKRLRQRFRELVQGELSDTVSSPGDMTAEQHALIKALACNS